jgi:hypothetical protein
MIRALLRCDQILEPTMIASLTGDKDTKDIMKIQRKVIYSEMINRVNGVDPVGGRFSPWMQSASL